MTAIDIASTKKRKTIATNDTNTASINCHSKKSKRLLYFTLSFTSDHITFDITIICYPYTKQKSIT